MSPLHSRSTTPTLARARAPRSRAARVAAGLCAAFSAAACSSAASSGQPAGGAAADPARASGSGAASAELDPETLVTLDLIADVTAVAPGQEVTLAARLAIAPGWHIYWTNPGEAGLPTDVSFTVPAGFRAGDARFPGPVRFESPGPIVSYGYAGQVLVSAAVEAPDPLPAGEHAFSVAAGWLACRETCIRGTGNASLRLPAATPERPSGPAHAGAFAAHRAALPRPLSALAGARHEWRDTGDARQLVVAIPGAAGAELSFFPTADTEPALIGRAARPGPAGSGEAQLWLMVRAGATRARGVLAVTRDTTEYYDLDIGAGDGARDGE